MKRRSLIQITLLAFAVSSAMAQVPSDKTIRILVPLGPGTPSDAISRALAPSLSAILNQPVIVENKPGANGIIAVQELMRSKPDGTTLLMGSVSPLAINMALVKKLPYDPRTDLTPIGGTYNASQVWVSRPGFPARTMAELVSYAKQNPGKVSAAHYSSLTQIQMSAINSLAGINLLMVPYKATSSAYADVMGGTVDLTIMDLATAIAQVKGGKVHPLGVTPLKRSALAPDWAAVSEAIPAYDFVSWSALVGPASMPKDVVERINAALVQSLKRKEVVQTMTSGGVTPWVTTPEELKAKIDSEVPRWIKLARDANIQPE
jgi:tripartite-type tricarboxylate transporter receptor subunit TctC